MSDLISDDAPAPNTALAVIPATNLPTILAADQNDILGKLRDKVRNHKPDISTPAGREKIRSLAYDIAQSKVALIKLGKSLTEDGRVKTKAVNAECNIIEEKMDALKEEIRAPLTEFENREKARVKAHEDALAAIQESPGFYADGLNSTAELEFRLDYLTTRIPPRDWQEFSARADDVIAAEIHLCKTALDRAIKSEAEAAELARFRAEQAERDRLDAIWLQEEREARISQEAAEAARIEAEARAAKQAQEAAQRAEEARLAAERVAQAERYRIELEAREAQEYAKREAARLQAEADAERERAEKAERDRQAAIDAARVAEENARERERLALETAERERVAAEKKSEAARLAAIETERKRAADEAAAIAKATAAREADKAHKSAVLRTAKEALMQHAGLGEEAAKKAIRAIYDGVIPAVKMEF